MIWTWTYRITQFSLELASYLVHVVYPNVMLCYQLCTWYIYSARSVSNVYICYLDDESVRNTTGINYNVYYSESNKKIDQQ
jgi:hypothetical protein